MYWSWLSQKFKQEEKPFPQKINLSKNEIAKQFNLPPEMSPHRAMKGVEHLIHCYEAVLNVKFMG
jgi:oligoribonuclease